MGPFPEERAADVPSTTPPRTVPHAATGDRADSRHSESGAIPRGRIRAGDVVDHRPTNETWVVGSVSEDGHDFFACGWPESRAAVADARLVASCSDAEHVAMLEMVARGRDDFGGATPRSWSAQRNLEDWRAGHPVTGVAPSAAGTAQDLDHGRQEGGVEQQVDAGADGTAKPDAHGEALTVLPQVEPASSGIHTRGGPSATRAPSVPASGLRAGDKVFVSSPDIVGEPTIASIGLTGRVYFRGTPRASALPEQCKLLYPASDEVHVAALEDAAGVSVLVHGEGAREVSARRNLAAWRAAHPDPDLVVAPPATPRATEDVDALRAEVIAARADARDQRSRASALERQLLVLADSRRETSPDEVIGWGWRAGGETGAHGPVATRQDAIEAAVRDLEVIYAETTDVPAGTEMTELIYVGRCVPWYPRALDAAGVLGAMDAEATRTTHLFAQVAPAEWTVAQKDDLGRRLRAAFAAWLDSIERARFWQLDRHEERVLVVIVVPERARRAAPMQVVGSAGDGSRS